MSITVNGRHPPGFFDRPTPDLIRQCIFNDWSIDNPNKAMTPADYSSKVRFADFDYDYFATYHVMITQEEKTKFDNDLIGQGLIKIFDPVLIEISARRLTHGKTFEELDNIRMEIIRIIANCEPDNLESNTFLSGIHAIEIVDPGDIQPFNQFINKLPRSIWRAQIKLMVHYFISYS